MEMLRNIIYGMACESKMNKTKKILKNQIKCFCETNNLVFHSTSEIIFGENEFFLFYIICNFKPSSCEVGIYFTPLFIAHEELTLTFGDTIPFLSNKANLELPYTLSEKTIIKRLNKNLEIALNKLNKWVKMITPDFIIQNIDRAKYKDIFYTEDIWKFELLGYCYGIVGRKEEANSMFLKLIELLSNDNIYDWEKLKLDEWKYALKMIESNQFNDFIECKIYETKRQFLS